jgi:nucleoid DNA-binding protein
MYDELYQLLILNKKLTIPGIGNFSMNRKPAEANFLEKLIHPPAYSITLQKESGAPSKSFFFRLAELLNITDREAVVQFNDFAFDLKKKIVDGNEVVWDGIGTLSMNKSGNVKFLPAEIPVIEESVAVEKVLREHTQHSVLVGERERTSVEMTELLSQPETKKSKWWIAALIAGVVLLAVVFWIFSKNEWTISATSNQRTISPGQEEPSYILLQ